MKARALKPSEAGKAFRNDAIELLRKYAGSLSAEVMLALSSHLVGQIIAMQDQRTMSKDRALETVMRNIEAGNAEVLAGLNNESGRA